MQAARVGRGQGEGAWQEDCHLELDLPCYYLSLRKPWSVSVWGLPSAGFCCGGTICQFSSFNLSLKKWGVGKSNVYWELFKRIPGFHSVLSGRSLFKMLSSVYMHRANWNKRLSIEYQSFAEELLKFHLVFFFFHEDVTWNMVKSNIIVRSVTGP